MRSRNRSIAWAALFGAGVLAAGCEVSEAKPSAGMQAVASPEQKFQKAEKKAAAAVKDTKDFARAVRGQFVTDMQSELVVMNKALQELSAKIERSNNAAKADAKAKLATLREKAAKVNAALEKARNAEEAVWEQVKASVQQSHEDLKQSVTQARTWLSDKIAP